jgi:hypothetical protein
MNKFNKRCANTTVELVDFGIIFRYNVFYCLTIKTHVMPRKAKGSKRGFAAMDREKQREISSKGGSASHQGGNNGSARGGR